MADYSRRHDIDRTTPVESRRGEKGGPVVDVVVPLLQSFAVSVLAAFALIAFINMIYNAGEFPFWIGTSCVSLAAFLWILKVQYHYGITPLDLVSAFLMSLLAGFFCWAFARVVTWAKTGGWLHMWTLSAFVFLLMFYLHAEFTLLQRLAQPWQFQQQAIWGAFKTLVEYWGKRSKKNEPTVGPVARTGRGSAPDSPEPEPYTEPESLTEVEMFLELARDYKTLKRDDSKEDQGLRGKLKSNGQPLTKTQWQDCIAWLIEYDYIKSGNGGYRWSQDMNAEIALSTFKR